MLTPSPNGARWPEPQPLANPGRFRLAASSRRRVRGVWPGGCGRGQAADAAVTQPVEHQLDQLTGGGDHPDVAAPPLPDPVADLPEPGVGTEALHGLDRGPPDQATALFG